MSDIWPDESDQPPAILSEVRDEVGIVTLNRPDKLNAWSPAMGTLYFNTLDQFAADENVRAILVTASGRAFCAGADMAGLGRIADSGGKTPDRDHRKYWYPMSIGKPIIAAVHGYCFGVGLQQALCCDLRFCATDAKFSFPYVKRGLIAELGLSWTLSRLIGTSNTIDMLMSGRVVEADEAKAMGLVNRTVAPDALFDAAFAYCTNLAANCSPWSMRVMKQQVYHDLMTATMEPAFERSEDLLMQALAGSEFAEGLAAFKEKRPLAFPPLPAELANLDPWPGD